MIYRGHNDITKLVKDKIRETGTIQARIAQALHIMPSAFSRVLNNSNMTIERLFEIAEALDCDLIIDLQGKE